MRQLVLLAILFYPSLLAAQNTIDVREVTSDLVIPWEIKWGPDDMLWTTERPGIISKIDPETGVKQVILDFQDETYAVAETGMLGLEFHPDFPDSPYVFVAICFGTTSPQYRTIERFTYDETSFENDTLVNNIEIFREPRITYSHLGCRLEVGPDRKLYASMGENAENEENAQDDFSTLGKILRMNLDGSVPDDNPVEGSLMWSKGHRNPQGLVFLPNGLLYSSEHGSTLEDEVNLIEPGRNYGWPFVEGPCDEPWEEDFCDTVDMVVPVFSSGREDTYAMCGLEFYSNTRIPFFNNSLLLATLRGSTLHQLKLNSDRTKVEEAIAHLPYGVGRIRDIAVSPDGRVFICTSNRQALAADPFPFPGDDKIYELVVASPDAQAELICPDTVYVNGPAGETHYFTVPVTNIGTGPTTVTDVVRVIEGGPIGHANWRMPFVIIPGATYDVRMRFYPWEEGDNVGHLRLVTDNGASADVIVIASTVVSVEEDDQANIGWGAFPNPSSDIVTFTLPPSVHQSVVRVYSITGELVWQADATGLAEITWNGRTLNGQSIAPGAYSVCISRGNTLHCTSFIRSNR